MQDRIPDIVACPGGQADQLIAAEIAARKASRSGLVVVAEYEQAADSMDGEQMYELMLLGWRSLHSSAARLMTIDDVQAIDVVSLDALPFDKVVTINDDARRVQVTWHAPDNGPLQVLAVVALEVAGE